MYSWVRPLLFQLDPEVAHHLTLNAIEIARSLKLQNLMVGKVEDKPVDVMGISFKNPVGLAAGLDKNGEHIDALSMLGFGFIEIGTITPRPQEGNPKPRLFRLPSEEAIINRMGFNNKGVDYLVEQVKKRRGTGVLGINIGKNKATPNEEAIDDYLLCMEKVYPYADYIAVNLSSPNTPGLRDLQFGDPLRRLLEQLKKKQSTLAAEYGRAVPLALKVAPDMADTDIADVASALLSFEIEGLIATNTTITRPVAAGCRHAGEAGGLSGKPLFDKSTQVLQSFSALLGSKLPIIAVGGINSADAAREKMQAGASLVQLYSGLVYKGPNLVKRVVDSL